MFKNKTCVVFILGIQGWIGCADRVKDGADTKPALNKEVAAIKQTPVFEKPNRVEVSALGESRTYPITAQVEAKSGGVSWDLGTVLFYTAPGQSFLEIPFDEPDLVEVRFQAYSDTSNEKKYKGEILAKADRNTKKIRFDLQALDQLQSTYVLAEWKDSEKGEKRVEIHFQIQNQGARIQTGGLSTIFNPNDQGKLLWLTQTVFQSRSELAAVSEAITNNTSEDMTILYRVSGAMQMTQGYSMPTDRRSGGFMAYDLYVSSSQSVVRQIRVQMDSNSETLILNPSGQASFTVPAGKSIQVTWLMEEAQGMYCSAPYEADITRTSGLSWALQFSRQIHWGQETLSAQSISTANEGIGNIYRALKPTCQGWYRTLR